MAKNDNLSDFMTDIADAIRAKKGTSEPINAQDFSAEIASIEGGGGSAMEYWSVPSGIRGMLLDGGALATSVVKIRHSNNDKIWIATPMILGMAKEVLAIAIDTNAQYYSGDFGHFTGEQMWLEYKDMIVEGGGYQITEEEFYKID